MDTNAGHNPGPTVNPDSVKRGHEADAYPTGGVVGIPIAVILTFVTFLPIAILLFWWMMVPKPEPKANPLALEANKGTAMRSWPGSATAPRSISPGWKGSSNSRIKAMRTPPGSRRRWVIRSSIIPKNCDMTATRD